MVLVWDENGRVPLDVHPEGIRGTVAQALSSQSEVRHLDMPDYGLAGLDEARVLIWWGHARHDELPIEVASDIAERVRRGELGLLILHSGHQSRVAEAMGIGCIPRVAGIMNLRRSMCESARRSISSVRASRIL